MRVFLLLHNVDCVLLYRPVTVVIRGWLEKGLTNILVFRGLFQKVMLMSGASVLRSAARLMVGAMR